MYDKNKIDFSQKDEHNNGRIEIPDLKFDPLDSGCRPTFIILQLPAFLRDVDDN